MPSDAQDGFETIKEMSLKHLPNDAKLVIQRQRGEHIQNDAVQFGLPTTFVNPDNGQLVWNRGPSIQLEQMPELIQMLQKTYDTFSDTLEKTPARTGTFADMIDR